MARRLVAEQRQPFLVAAPLAHPAELVDPRRNRLVDRRPEQVLGPLGERALRQVLQADPDHRAGGEVGEAELEVDAASEFGGPQQQAQPRPAGGRGRGTGTSISCAFPASAICTATFSARMLPRSFRSSRGASAGATTRNGRSQPSRSSALSGRTRPARPLPGRPAPARSRRGAGRGASARTPDRGCRGPRGTPSPRRAASPGARSDHRDHRRVERHPAAVGLQAVDMRPEHQAQLGQALPKAGRTLLLAAVAPELVLQPGTAAPQVRRGPENARIPCAFRARGVRSRPRSSRRLSGPAQGQDQRVSGFLHCRARPVHDIAGLPGKCKIASCKRRDRRLR